MAAKKTKVIRRWTKKRKPARMSGVQKLIRCILLLPSLYLLAERAIFFPFENSALSSYLDVEHVAVSTTIKKKEVKRTPVASVRSPIFETPWRRRKSLEALTQPFRVTDTSSDRCPSDGEVTIAGYRYIGATDSPETETNSSTSLQQKIPKLFHQQGPSRCISSTLHDLNEQWATELEVNNDDGREWSMFFHTEDAMTRLFRAIIAVQEEEKYSRQSTLSRIGKEFPHLGQILRNCVDNRSFFRRLLWRFLCLYAYGGMYVDLGSRTLPQTYDDIAKSILRDSYNTALLWTTVADDAKTTYPSKNETSQTGVQINANVIAVSPGHPLMYYAVQHSLSEIITDTYVGEKVDIEFSKAAQNKAISNILKRALVDFYKDHTIVTETPDREKPFESSLDQSFKLHTFLGTGNASVKILNASELAPIDFTELINGEDLSFESKMLLSLNKSRLKSSSCLFKSLADASTIST